MTVLSAKLNNGFTLRSASLSARHTNIPTGKNTPRIARCSVRFSIVLWSLYHYQEFRPNARTHKGRRLQNLSKTVIYAQFFLLIWLLSRNTWTSWFLWRFALVSVVWVICSISSGQYSSMFVSNRIQTQWATDVHRDMTTACHHNFIWSTWVLFYTAPKQHRSQTH